MDEPTLATEASKTELENAVRWHLAEKLEGASPAPIVTQKFLTNDNVLVYLTYCAMPEGNVPRIKVQLLSRVDGGVHETGYQLFGDHRLERYENEMLFGAAQGADGSERTAVTQDDLAGLLQLLAALPETARKTV